MALLASPLTASKANQAVIRPPPTRKITCNTSVKATDFNPPQIEYKPANKNNPIIPYIMGTSRICSIANAPNQATEVRFTKTYTNNQKKEKKKATPVP